MAATLLALNVQTYGRLTYERPVATIQLRKLAPQYFEVTVIQPPAAEGEPSRVAVYPVNGDDWRIEAQVLKWKPWANVLGLDTQYRLDRLSGRYENIEQERTGARSVHALSGGESGTQVMGPPCRGRSAPGTRRGAIAAMSTPSTPCTAARPICRWPTGPATRSGSPSPA
jgi:hypothetical protein